MDVAAAAPGVFTLDASGKGQAVALNQDGSLNGTSNPAKAGDVVSFYATGVGLGSATVSIGGAPANTAALQQWSPGVTQIDIRIPAGTTAGGAPVLIQVGNTSSQPGVTVAVR